MKKIINAAYRNKLTNAYNKLSECWAEPNDCETMSEVIKTINAFNKRSINRLHITQFTFDEDANCLLAYAIGYGKRLSFPNLEKAVEETLSDIKRALADGYYICG